MGPKCYMYRHLRMTTGKAKRDGQETASLCGTCNHSQTHRSNLVLRLVRPAVKGPLPGSCFSFNRDRKSAGLVDVRRGLVRRCGPVSLGCLGPRRSSRGISALRIAHNIPGPQCLPRPPPFMRGYPDLSQSASRDIEVKFYPLRTPVLHPEALVLPLILGAH